MSERDAPRSPKDPNCEPAAGWPSCVGVNPVIALQPTADESSAIVLLEAPLGASTVRNLVKINRNAEVIWRAELPHPNPVDCYVSCEVDADANVVASTWSGYRVLLAGDTGIVLSYEFVK